MIDQQALLKKMGIEKLNPMQQETASVFQRDGDVLLLSPTGTGKTLAFLLPLISKIDPEIQEIQALIITPSRELALQIEQVFRDLGSGVKVNAVYGGRAGSKDKIELKHRPAVLIGTPGRVADHLRRENFSTTYIDTIVLDEFDKSLDIGFEKEMMDIVDALPHLEKRIFTSATQKARIPDFMQVKLIHKLDFTKTTNKSNLEVKMVYSPDKDKLNTLSNVLKNLGDQSGIVFCNFKDTIAYVSEFLESEGVEHGVFYGGMEQIDRERALLKFRNGSHRILLATDLAARGIDINALDYIVHYQLPYKEEEFVHRNGRTARMNAEGTAYIVHWKEAPVPDFLGRVEEASFEPVTSNTSVKWKTLYITGGRKDKISKGDIAGFFMKAGGLKKDELGLIEIKRECAFVAVPDAKVKSLIAQLNNQRLKKKKIRISLA